MANRVRVKITGGDMQIMDNVYTLGEVKQRTNTQAYTGTVFGETRDDSHQLTDGDFVNLAQSTKGGNVN